MRHGTNQGWLDGCRERCCINARQAWRRKTARLRVLRGQDTRRKWDFRPYKEKLEKYLERGYSLRDLSEQTGISKRTLYHILKAERSYIWSDTAKKIAAIPPTFSTKERPAENPYQVMDGTGTVRRLRALYWMGYSAEEVVKASGENINPQQVHRILMGLTGPTVQKRVHDAVKHAYDYLLVRDVPEEPRQVRSKRRNKAEALGWLAPGWWRDIDNPREDPTKFMHRTGKKAAA